MLRSWKPSADARILKKHTLRECDEFNEQYRT